MVDQFQSFARAPTAPADGAFAVTPNNSTDLPQATRALYIGVSGNLAVTMLSGESVTLINVQAGTVLPLRLAKVMATDTTAQNIIGLV